MSFPIRSAMLQARVTPEVKLAGEEVLRRIGLTMTEAMELFLRRVIIEQRLPFEVAALDRTALTSTVETLQERAQDQRLKHGQRDRNRMRQRRE